MKRYLAFAFGAALVFSLAPRSGAAPQFDGNRGRDVRDRVCVYKDADYNGWEQCYSVGDEIRSLGGQKDKVSSIRIFGRARVIVYDQTDFEGRMTDFVSNVPDLSRRAASGGHTWNDRIESLRITTDYASGPIGDPPAYDRDHDRDRRDRNQITEGVCVYDRPNYAGRFQCWDADADLDDLARIGNWSNRIMSIRLLGGARVVVYREAGFRGESILIARDMPDLSELPGRGFRTWNRQISSLQIDAGRDFRRGRGYARGRN